MRPWQLNLKNTRAEQELLLPEVQRPEATPEELQNLASIARFSAFTEATEGLIEALCAHPNIPPDELLPLLTLRPQSAADGFFRNPILPLLILEQPDFFSRLETQRQFDTLLTFLRQPNPPLPLLQTLSRHEIPWIALEAQTHAAMPLPDSALDLDNLEEQILKILEQENAVRRDLVCELVERGVLPSRFKVPDPLDAPDFQARLQAVPSHLVDEAIVKARTRKRIRPRRNEPTLYTLYSEYATHVAVSKEEDYLLFWTRLLLYPDVPAWVSEEVMQWSIDNRSDFSSTAGPMRRRCTVPTHRANKNLIAHCRNDAIYSALQAADRQYYKDRAYLCSPCPGIAYLVLRTSPEGVNFRSHYDWGYRPLENVLEKHFLYRLGVALRLHDADENCMVPDGLIEQLQNDPNRYVRAAVCGQWRAVRL